MIAAIYARKSTKQDGDAEDRSVQRQVDDARAFAAERGFIVAAEHVYQDDGVSGALGLDKLKDKKRMLDAIHSGAPPFQVLIMQSNDRLSRQDGHVAFAELEAIDLAGVQVWFYSDGRKFEHGTFATNVMGVLHGEVAAEFRRVISVKTRESLVRKVSHGYVAGGRRFGYDNVRVDGHTEYRVNEAQAAVVRDIYERYARGEGLPTIAHALNTAKANSPQAQQGRMRGWCPSSVREILKRPLYRGELVYGRGKKVRKKERNGEVKLRSVRQPESEWKRKPMPELRIVPQAVADAVDARFAAIASRQLRRPNGRVFGRPGGEGSQYLLVGLLKCATCGGGMEVLSSTSGKRRTFHYKCTTARRKGPACCTNRLPAPMAEADAAVIAAVERTLMRPAIVEKALAQAEREIARGRTDGARESLESELGDVAKAMRRLSVAMAKAGDLDPLLEAYKAHERQRADLQARLDAMREPSPMHDPAAVRVQLKSYLQDWNAMLRGQVGQAQQVLRRLINGKLVFTPNEAGFYEFSGRGTVRPLLAGVVRMLASPAGTTEAYNDLPIAGAVNRRAA